MSVLWIVLQIPAEPNCRKMSPAQFSDHVVPPVKQITNLHRVVTTWNTAGAETQCRNQQENTAVTATGLWSGNLGEEEQGHLYMTLTVLFVSVSNMGLAYLGWSLGEDPTWGTHYLLQI